MEAKSVECPNLPDTLFIAHNVARLAHRTPGMPVGSLEEFFHQQGA